MTAEILSESLDFIDEKYLIESEHLGRRARRPLRWLALAACLCLAALFVWSPWAAAPTTPETTADLRDMFPGDIRPAILVRGVLYRLAPGPAVLEGADTPEGPVTGDGTGKIELPEGFTEYGEVASTTESEPAGELQMMAGAPVTGTVYVNESLPDAVYLVMRYDLPDQDRPFAARFVTAALDGGPRIFHDGILYGTQLGVGRAVTALPEGAEPIGTLTYTGRDSLPQGELATNCPADTYSRALQGRQVYRDPADPGTLYVYERRSWAGGDYDGWMVWRAVA